MWICSEKLCTRSCWTLLSPSKVMFSKPVAIITGRSRWPAPCFSSWPLTRKPLQLHNCDCKADLACGLWLHWLHTACWWVICWWFLATAVCSQHVLKAVTFWEDKPLDSAAHTVILRIWTWHHYLLAAGAAKGRSDDIHAVRCSKDLCSSARRRCWERQTFEEPFREACTCSSCSANESEHDFLTQLLLTL